VIALITRYRYTAAWGAYVIYCLGVYQMTQAWR